jgi:hypothetical protein
MRRNRRVVLAAAISILLGTAAAVAFTSMASVASTNQVNIGGCQIDRTPNATATCTASGTATRPEQIVVGAVPTPGTATGEVGFVWTIDCGAGSSQGSGDISGPGPGGGYPGLNVPLGVTDPASCSVTVKATVLGAAGDITSFSVMIVNFPQPAATPTPTPSPTSSSGTSAAASPVHLVRGFDGTCLRDLGDSTAPRTKVVIWACDPTAQGQGWTYRGGELIIHSHLCVNAKGTGKSGSVVILWPCDAGPNEIWVHRSAGQYALKANGYKSCLEDPAYSTRNGTQLIVAACSGAHDQRWTLP